ncbi:MAG: glutamine-hydrolyzing GMP synthase [Candidatus Bipolaricaulia bacterium]
MNGERVLIVDFGSQYTRLIARLIREHGVYTDVVTPDVDADELRRNPPSAVVLSGGPASVYDADAPEVPETAFRLGVPTLGICYGSQLLAHQQGGRVERAQPEYGTATVRIERQHKVLAGLDNEERVWMSHGDVITELPDGFRVLARSQEDDGTDALIAAIGNDDGSMIGLQFHPEVQHTPRGRQILRNWLFDVCGLHGGWAPAGQVDRLIERTSRDVGDGRALIAVSGGVDSSTAAVLAHRALGERLLPVFVDTGLLRESEPERVRDVFHQLGLDVDFVDAKERFYEQLRGVVDPEAKRRIIGETFIRVFEEEAARLQARVGPIDLLIQGTIHSDVIESGGTAQSARIKSHHNVGGLPERLGFRVVEPLRDLFKDEVREVGRALGLPDAIVDEPPFPGPGLAVRILGEVHPEQVEVLQRADAILRHEIAQAGLRYDVWQYFAVLLPQRSVAVRGDERGYGHVVALRAVDSRDGMTADWYRLPHELLATVSGRITNEIPDVTRVVYDVTSKPPGTIEWE